MVSNHRRKESVRMSDNNSIGRIVQSQVDANKFMQSVVKRTTLFLAEEASINVADVRYVLTDVQKLQLKELTSIITVEDEAKMILAFSYDRALINEIFAKYSQGIEIDESETDQYIEETAGDMINIILGNVLAEFQQNDRAFAVSTPIIVNEAKSIARYKNGKFFTAELETSLGTMAVFCITPGELLRQRLVKKQGGTEL